MAVSPKSLIHTEDVREEQSEKEKNSIIRRQKTITERKPNMRLQEIVGFFKDTDLETIPFITGGAILLGPLGYGLIISLYTQEIIFAL